MPGKETAPVPASEARQAEAFEGGPGRPPPDWINPPGNDQFDNATHMIAGPIEVKVVRDLIKLKEFAPIRAFPYKVVWRKQTKPMIDDMPVFAGVEVAGLLWRFLSEGALGFAVNLHWAHFDELRAESKWVHPDTLAQHAHHALMHLHVTPQGTLKTRQPPIRVFAETVKRHGAWNTGLLDLANQLKLWTPEEVE